MARVFYYNMRENTLKTRNINIILLKLIVLFTTLIIICNFFSFKKSSNSFNRILYTRLNNIK